uniref:YggT family protein n=1 Tax=Candidatus Scatousia sp. TaxID=3085663 RepID=UPI004027E9F9
MIRGIINGINNIFLLFYVIILLRIFLSWIPNIDWQKQPWNTIRNVADAYLGIFRKFIPPFSGLDFSPIIALIVLQVIQNIVIYVLINIGKGLL